MLRTESLSEYSPNNDATLYDEHDENDEIEVEIDELDDDQDDVWHAVEIDEML